MAVEITSPTGTPNGTQENALFTVRLLREGLKSKAETLKTEIMERGGRMTRRPDQETASNGERESRQVGKWQGGKGADSSSNFATLQSPDLITPALSNAPAGSPSNLQTFAPSNKVARVIIVTSWFHSRRALACFKKAGPEFEYYSRPSYYAYRCAEWPRSGVSTHIRSEYLKIAGYVLVHGVWAF